MTTTAIATQEVNENQIAVYLDSLWLGSSAAKLVPVHKEQFAATCLAYGLNPLKREIYAVPYAYENPVKRTFSIIIAYEVFLRRAENSGRMRGWRTWFEEAKTLDGRPDIRACIEIAIEGWDKPFVHEVYLSEYTGDKPLWRAKPRTMLKKVVIAQGFRLAFPNECGKLPYIAEELDLVEPQAQPHRFAQGKAQPRETEAVVFESDTPTQTTPEQQPASNTPQNASDEAKPDPFAADPKPDKPADPPPPAKDPENPTLFNQPERDTKPPQTNSGTRLGHIATIRSLFAQEDENTVTKFFISKRYIGENECLDDMDLEHSEKVVKNGAACLQIFGVWKKKHG